MSQIILSVTAVDDFFRKTFILGLFLSTSLRETTNLLLKDFPTNLKHCQISNENTLNFIAAKLSFEKRTVKNLVNKFQKSNLFKMLKGYSLFLNFLPTITILVFWLSWGEFEFGSLSFQLSLFIISVRFLFLKNIFSVTPGSRLCSCKQLENSLFEEFSILNMWATFADHFTSYDTKSGSEENFSRNKKRF